MAVVEPATRRPAVAARVGLAVALAGLLAVPAVPAAAVGYARGTALGWLAGAAGTAAVLLLVRFFWGALLGKFLVLVLLAQIVLATSAGSSAPDVALRQHGTRVVASILWVDAQSGTHGHSTYHLLGPGMEMLDVDSPGRPHYRAGDHVTVLLDPHGRLDPTLQSDTALGWVIDLDAAMLACLLVIAHLVVAAPWTGDRRRLRPPPLRPDA